MNQTGAVIMRQALVQRAVRPLVACQTAYIPRQHPAWILLQSLRSNKYPSNALSPSDHIRSYATAAKPKKITTKTTTKTTTRTTKAKPKTKAAATKKKPALKKKKKKVVAKKKKKPATRTRKPKKPKTDLEKQRIKVRELRSQALLNAPKPAPTSGYRVYIHDTTLNNKATLTEASKGFKTLSADQQSAYRATAARNREANAAALKKWLESHTPEQIQTANNARHYLNRIFKQPKPAGSKASLVGHRLPTLKDVRAPKRTLSAFSAYTKERWTTGDFRDVRLVDASKSLSKEWSALPVAEKARYKN